MINIKGILNNMRTNKPIKHKPTTTTYSTALTKNTTWGGVNPCHIRTYKNFLVKTALVYCAICCGKSAFGILRNNYNLC